MESEREEPEAPPVKHPAGPRPCARALATTFAVIVAGTLSETLERADEGSRFFEALAEQDPARMAVIRLPYQVRH